MNERRRETYLSIIDSLIVFPEGLAISILRGNHPNFIESDEPDIFDEGLLETLLERAQWFYHSGQEDAARKMMNLAQHFQETLGLLGDDVSDVSTETPISQPLPPALLPLFSFLPFPTEKTDSLPLSSSPQETPPTNVDSQGSDEGIQYIVTPDQQVYLNFLMEVLQKVAEDPSSQSVYPLLAQNLDKLNETFRQILEWWANQTLSQAKPESAQYIAQTIGNFSALLADFPLGDTPINREIDITGCHIALTIFTQDTSPDFWADRQYNLGTAYWNRLKGDKEENLEQAITAFKNALTVRTRENFSVRWAAIQNNLGLAYKDRIKGDKKDNLEKAITAFENALTVATRENFPLDWASTQNNLGLACTCRIAGNKGENLEKAIKACKNALTVRTRENFPLDWARTQNNLGLAYTNRIQGNKGENIEQAIAAYKNALIVHTCEQFPLDWAMAQNNLGLAYTNRIQGNKRENIEQAIIAFESALTVRTRENLPIDWAATQNNLAIAYRSRINKDKRENLEKAIIAYENALTVFTRENFPLEWATTQSNLGVACKDRIKGDKGENIEQAITACENALIVFTLENFPLDWAGTQNNLGEGYRNRINGYKGENLEKAIAAYKNALIVHTCEQFPLDWAGTQNNLGAAYIEHIKGNKKENLEQAITAFENALKVYTRENFPLEWATTQSNLGVAYSNRIEGDKGENIDKGISSYENALTAINRENFPLDWANTQNNLGGAYCERIKGDKRENLEKAITAFENALTVFTRENFPVEWAGTQNNLGVACKDRIKGDKKENLEQAITAFENALKVYTRENFPLEWAKTRSNLGIAYSSRLQGDKGINIEWAISAYENALKVTTHEHIPLEWARTQNNLGTAYSDRIKGDKEENIEKAITAFENALKVYTRKNFPLDWTTTQNNLGIAYSDRIKGDKEENIEKAIAACEKTLEVTTRENFPVQWAMTQNSLGNAYYNRIKGDKGENIEKASAAFENALTIYTIEAFPEKSLAIAQNLGHLGYQNEKWQIAIKGYALAVETAETLRSEALTGDRKQEILSQAIQVYHGIVHTYINLYHQENNPQHLKTALEYIERSKARNLVELMTQKNLKPQGVNQATINTLDELRQNVVNEQKRLEVEASRSNLSTISRLEPYVRDYSHLKEYQQELDDFIKDKISKNDPTFSLTQKVEPIPFNQIQALTDAETCLLQWYITNDKILAFVVSSSEEIKVWESSAEDLQTLRNTIKNYLNLYADYRQDSVNKTQWREQLPNLLQTFTDTLHINDILALIPNTCKRLIIVPHRALHILPIHALPVTVGANCVRPNSQDLQDLFPNGVQYSPSCQLLKIAQRFHHANFNKLFAIQNPTQDLIYTDLEVTTLSTFFTKSRIIAKDEATKNAVIPHLKPSDNHCHHFSCHGSFNPNNPLKSALSLANKEPLTLGEIFELNLNQSRLVVLSACETGLIDLQSLSDEYIGLPSGFLFAGSSTVVSSLWTVNDLSTAFLMIKFYKSLQQYPDLKAGEVAIALKQAQNCLRTLTVEQFEQDLERIQPRLDRALKQFRRGQHLIFEESLKQIRKRQPYPFENLYYWAGFTATGF